MGKNGFSLDLNSESRTSSFEPNNSLLLSAHSDPQNEKTMRFMSMSMGLHALLLIGIATATLPTLEIPQVETITVDLTDGSGSSYSTKDDAPNQPQAGSDSAPAPAVKQAPATPAPKATSSASANSAEDIVAPTPVSKKMSAVQAPPTVRPVEKSFPSHPTEVAPRAEMNLDDLDSDTELDDSMAEVTKIKSRPDFDKEIQTTKSQKDRVANIAMKRIEAEANALQAEQDSEVETIAAQERARSEKAAKALARMQAENAAALTAARALEEQERQSRLKALAANRGNGMGSGNGNGSGSSMGTGSSSGNGTGSGSSAAGTGAGLGTGNSSGNGKLAAGSPGGVRSVSQLKQVPGNPIPKYSNDERMKKADGTVIFLAYVSRDGSLVDFKQKRSTGHASLDSKTLDALRKWKFYPGQEGWVEIPMNWSLKGGARETSALNRVLSRN